MKQAETGKTSPSQAVNFWVFPQRRRLTGTKVQGLQLLSLKSKLILLDVCSLKRVLCSLILSSVPSWEVSLHGCCRRNPVDIEAFEMDILLTVACRRNPTFKYIIKIYQ